MKIIFAGPSLYGVDFDPGDVVLHGPAQMGDIDRAIAAGATAIGLIDGHYQQVGAVWHKEILSALAAGIAVYGAASMGALRAAECEVFGMIPVGDVALRYCTGELFDDADVALTNGPAELGFPPLTEALVDVEATAGRLWEMGLISCRAAEAIVTTARSIFFADRTIEILCAALGPSMADLYRTHRVARKTTDALALVSRLRAVPDIKAGRPRSDWHLANSPFWVRRALPRSSSVTLL